MVSTIAQTSRTNKAVHILVRSPFQPNRGCVARERRTARSSKMMYTMITPRLVKMVAAIASLALVGRVARTSLRMKVTTRAIQKMNMAAEKRNLWPFRIFIRKIARFPMAPSR